MLRGLGGGGPTHRPQARRLTHNLHSLQQVPLHLLGAWPYHRLVCRRHARSARAPCQRSGGGDAEGRCSDVRCLRSAAEVGASQTMWPWQMIIPCLYLVFCVRPHQRCRRQSPHWRTTGDAQCGRIAVPRPLTSRLEQDCLGASPGPCRPCDRLCTTAVPRRVCRRRCHGIGRRRCGAGGDSSCQQRPRSRRQRKVSLCRSEIGNQGEGLSPPAALPPPQTPRTRRTRAHTLSEEPCESPHKTHSDTTRVRGHMCRTFSRKN